MQKVGHTDNTESADFREIQRLYSAQAYELVIEKAKLFERNFGASPMLSQVNNLHGLALLVTKKSLLAIHHFKVALEVDAAPAVRNALLFNLATAQFEAGSLEEAEKTLGEANQAFMDEQTKTKAQQLGALIAQKRGVVLQPPKPQEVEAAVKQDSVGVLLPLTGKFAKFGVKSLHAIELAFRIFNLDEPDSKLTLVIKDSGETIEDAIAALSELYYKHNVIAVIGPLLSRGIDQIVEKAKSWNLPIMSLAQQQPVQVDDKNTLFQAAMTPKLQAREIAAHAINNLGLKRFAIVHPRDKSGDQFAHAYWDAVEALGGEVTAVESYAPGETDFRQTVDKLAGLYYTDARQREVDALAKERELNKIKKKNRKTEKFFNLTPIVDFEAVFIPDEARVASQIIPTFAYRDVDGVKFLGTANWNSPDLATRAQSAAEGATFVDAFFAGSSSPAVKVFIERFRQTFAEEPTSIEAIAYDAASILELALRNHSANTRSGLQNALRSVTKHRGVTGMISCQASGQFSRNLTVLTIKAGKITEVGI